MSTRLSEGDGVSTGVLLNCLSLCLVQMEKARKGGAQRIMKEGKLLSEETEMEHKTDMLG